MDSKSFGRNIKAHRIKYGWNLECAAERIGISARYLADIERGDKVPKLETFVKIINTLSASADDILQDNLVVGYIAKSNSILQKLNSLDAEKRKQALDIFDSVLSSIK